MKKWIELLCHDQTRTRAFTRLLVGISRSRDLLRITYRVPWNVSELLLPPRSEPKRQNGLWQRTCFEAFIRVDGSTEYLELNLSPSGEWASYVFEAYRKGMTEARLEPVKMVSSANDFRYQLSALLQLPDFAEMPWTLNLAAVLEEKAGHKSYWALAHPPGSPDFHHPDCFTLELPAPGRP